MVLLPKRVIGPGTIGLISPSGHIVDPDRLEAAVAYFEARGWRVKRSPHVLGKWKYFSAPDAERLADLHAMAADPEVDVVMPARGGYGLSRLLDRLDYAALAASRKVFVGFSDFTVFNLALLARADFVTFSGPMARVDFGNASVDALTEQNFWPLIESAQHTTPALQCSHSYHAQTIEGVTWGTNLSVICHLVGTPFFSHFDGGILIVEDVGEEPYHIERCFLQLKLAGVLDRQRAIILGTFNGFDPESDIAKRHTMADVAETLREIAPCPVLTGFPFGHAPEKITIPVGGAARLEIREGEYRLTFSRYNK
jgi:muramoyltetrapeptide carboxypeptidase